MRALLAVWLLIVATASANETDVTAWQEITNSQGIRVYSATAAETPIIKVKAIAEIDADLDSVLKIIEDETSYPEWVPYLSQAKVLQTISSNEKLVYNLFDAPWPARDRDFIYRLLVQRDENQLSYIMRSEISPLMPEQEKIVRAWLMESHYYLTRIDQSRTRIELVFHADPRGRLPVWIVNIVHRSFPFDAIKGLRAQLNAE